MFALELHYDEEGDVLYASVNKPRAALSVEIDTDLLLRYVPPDHATIGVTIIGFLERYPCPTGTPLLDHARSIVADVLKQYPEVPKDEAVI
jgi:hypothetical protein